MMISQIITSAGKFKMRGWLFHHVTTKNHTVTWIVPTFTNVTPMNTTKKIYTTMNPIFKFIKIMFQPSHVSKPNAAGSTDEEFTPAMFAVAVAFIILAFFITSLINK